MSTDVVTAASLAFLVHGEKGRDMVLYIKPIADVPSLAIDRNRLVQEGLAYDCRNQFFAVLERAVIVGAI